MVTAYTLAFGSLLLLGGLLADLLARNVTFLAGLAGFAGVSALGGASVNFTVLISARACHGAFAALLVPSAVSLLTTTCTEPRDQGRAFAVYGDWLLPSTCTIRRRAGRVPRPHWQRARHSQAAAGSRGARRPGRASPGRD